MQAQPKYSESARAFSFLKLPGGPTRNNLLAKELSHERNSLLTLGLGELLDEVVEGLVGAVGHQVLQEPLEELVDLVLLEELLDRLLEVETL